MNWLSRLSYVVALLILAGSFSRVLVGADLPRHVDPAELVAENPYPVNLFYLYHLFFGSVMREQFSEAPSWLKLALEVYTPANVKAVMDRLNQLLGSEVVSLNSTSVRIDAAFLQLRRMNASMVKELVREASLYLAEANVTMGGVEDSQRQLGKLLGASPDPMLADSADVRRLIATNMRILAGLLESAENIDRQIDEGTRIATRLSISPTASVVLVGGSFGVEGRLVRADGSPLAFRGVRLLVDGLVVEVASTDRDGGFTSSLVAPFEYKKEIKVSAEYLPTGADSGRLLPGFSGEARVGLIYYTPAISLDLSDSAYPGRDVTIRGALTYGDGLEGFRVTVYYLSGAYTATTSRIGGWSVVIPVPADAAEGLAPVIAEGSPRGVYGPSSGSGALGVYRIPCTLTVNVPWWAVSATRVQIRGTAVAGGAPLANAGVRVIGSVGEQSTVTDSGGAFSAWVDFPSPLLTRDYAYSVAVKPVEPWIRGASYQGSIFLLNVYTFVGGPSVALLGLVYGSRVLRRGKRGEGVEAEEALDSAVVMEPRMISEPTGVSDYYVNSVALVWKRAGVASSLSQTLREYFSAVKDLLPTGAAEVFRLITLAYERVLYGVPISPDVGEIRGLYLKLVEALSYEK